MKTRQQGNSIVINVPSHFNIGLNKEYVAFADEDGVLTYIPKKENIFEEALNKGKTIDVGKGFPEDEPKGKEMI